MLTVFVTDIDELRAKLAWDDMAEKPQVGPSC